MTATLPQPAAAGGAAGLTAFVVTAAPYSATGLGVADDTVALQAAIDAASAAGGGIVYVPPGTYRIATTLNLKSNVWLFGAGRGASILLLDDVAAVGIGLNNGAGTTGSTTLSANLTEYSTTATVTSAAGFSIGDVVEFSSANDRYGTWTVKITNIVGTTITLEEPSPAILLTSDTAVMRKWALATNVKWTDLTVRTNAVTPTLRTQPIWLTRFNGLHMERIAIDRSARDTANFEHGLDLTVRDCEGRDCIANGTALGWSVFSTTNAKLSGLRSHNCALGVTLYGSPRSTVSDCQTINSTSLGSRGLKVEAGSNYSTVTNCVISNVDTGHDGFHISDCWGVVMDNFSADSCGEGVSITETITGRTHDITLSNFSIRKTTEVGGGYGIRVSAVLVTNAMRLVIGPGTIADTLGAGISIAGGTDFTISGVIFTGTGKSGISFTPASSVDLWASISNCEFSNCGTSGSDGCIFLQNANRVNVTGGVMRSYFSTASGIQISATGNPTNNHFSNVIIDNAGSGAPYTNSGTGTNILEGLNWTSEFPNFGANDIVRVPPRQVTLTDAATVTLRASRGTYFTLSAGAGRTIAAPTDPAKGMEITIDILNNTGGAITTTWNAAYKLGGAWTDPATTKRRTIRFRYDGTSWIEIARATGDI
jgi:hypothetical protein